MYERYEKKFEEEKNNGYVIELFWKGLPSKDSKIGRFILSSKDYDKLEDNFSHDLSIDLYTDDSSEKKDKYKDVVEVINQSAIKHFGSKIY